ncbi:2Fe-2S iron-sulfur cluster-binding protein [Sphingomonas sp. MG17]|jgi:2Fe-2S ferredoxin|uniref:2Fe-2S iron-sulfur cluster-binding protein n=1 Tax=Sphingomonas tagetis TaxID=2949092 RepID=A0A9X2HKA9_9SPHN|nr:2Fe-2S iron-sulfur cluster-binding protein [Sphingomonas tagetis]MCP3732781.1 2Fe-2S iron-sulfur cluster-binding protein [Sphingomonas tagetis]
MPKLVFIEANGAEHVVEAQADLSAMEVAVRFNINGIDGDCGGQAACATCHVFVDRPWMERVGKPSEHEVQMLELAEGAADNSRLACQVIVTPELDGLVLHMPAAQF